MTLNYTLSRKKLYSYRLIGFDNQWSESSTRHTATYTHLDAGTYTFAVRGTDNTVHLFASIDDPAGDPAAFLADMVVPAGLFPRFGGAAFHDLSARDLRLKKRQAMLERLVQEKTREAEMANRAKSAFLATMSHEIRTPLNGVIGMSTLLANTTLTKEQSGYTHTIMSCGESLMSVINDIFDFSKIEAGSMELDIQAFDLRRCIEDVLDVFSLRLADNHVALSYAIEPGTPLGSAGDEVRLKQVLMNLVGDAVKFTKKGEVQVAVRALGPGLAAPGLAVGPGLAAEPGVAGDGRVRLPFVVRDTGVGIAADRIDRLFKAFSQADSSVTRQYGGTGLGLVISEKLIRMMDGSIEVSSVVGEGTTYTSISRPGLAWKPARSRRRWATRRLTMTVSDYAVTGKIPDLASKFDLNILVAEDVIFNRLVIENVLNKLGFSPVLVENGQEAVERIAAQESTWCLWMCRCRAGWTLRRPGDQADDNKTARDRRDDRGSAGVGQAGMFRGGDGRLSQRARSAQQIDSADKKARAPGWVYDGGGGLILRITHGALK